MAASFWLKTGDLKPSITATLTDATGAAVDINGAVVVFVMRPIDGSVPMIVSVADNLQTNPATIGHVKYEWQAGDTEVAGGYRAEWRVTFVDGKEGTFPNDGDVYVAILESVEVAS